MSQDSEEDENELVHPISPLLFLVPILAGLQCLVPSLVKKLVSLTSSASPEERRLIDEINALKEEQREISMMDDFARHAKIERKIIKLRERLGQLGTNRSTERIKASTAFNITIYSLLGLICLFLAVTYGRGPLVVLHPNWLYPLGWFISLPSWVSGAIGLPFWTIASRSAVKSVQQALTK